MSLWLCKTHGLVGPMACCREAGRVHSVGEYGAKGDGKTDDTAAIQQAITVASGCHPEGE